MTIRESAQKALGKAVEEESDLKYTIIFGVLFLGLAFVGGILDEMKEKRKR